MNAGLITNINKVNFFKILTFVKLILLNLAQ